MIYKPLFKRTKCDVRRAAIIVKSASAHLTSPIAVFSLIAFVLTATTAFGQVPVITHVDRYINGNGQRITISGSDFGSQGDLVVWFGAAKGLIESATDQTIEVAVPAGATYESIVVTNTASGKSAFSKGEFLLSYGGEHPFALAKLAAQSDLATETGLFDVCLCDLDGDGLNEVASSNSGGTTGPPDFGITLYLNTSTAGSAFTFGSKISFLPSTRTLNIKCGDLNGDGKKELIVSESDPGNRIFILKNESTGTGSLAFTPQNIPLVGKSPKRVDVADLDMDGLPELVVTDQNTENKDLLILPNTSSGGTISFGTLVPLQIPFTSNTGSDGLAVQDVDNDNRPEIIISQVLSSSGNVYVYKNESRPGNFIFTKVTKADIAPGTPNATGAPINVRVGDIDGDSKPDIAVAHFLGSKISILLNQSTPTAIQFGTPVPIATDPFPFGLDLGDLDGDGKLDVAVASLTGPVTEANPKSLTILNNTSTPGTVSFLPRLTQATTFINRHILIGDVDGDAKPDITYASVDDNTRGVLASNISFFRNQSCIKPVITPGGALVVCSSFPLELKGPLSAGAVYQWKKDGADIGTPVNTFTPAADGNYTLNVTSDVCTRTSNSVAITISTGVATTPTFTNNSPVCAGGTINLTAISAGGEEFNWTGPAGFTASTASITRTPYEAKFAGRYEVEIKAGGCIAAKGSTLVETISLPAFVVNFTGSDVICAGDTKILTASPNDTDFTYQWADANGDITGATNATLNVNATGSYSFKAKSILYPTSCPEVPAEAVSLLVATPPGVDFQIPAETCKDTQVTFTNVSTVQEDAGPNYKWEFGDTGTSTDKNTVHTYTVIADRTVKLTVSYRGNTCSVEKTKTIKILAPPTATITAPDNVFKFCEGDKLTLSVTPAFSEYLWSTTATSPTVDVTTGGNYSVELKNAIGCKITVNQDVTMMPRPPVTATADPEQIDLGQSTQLEATPGYASYEWTPSETLDSSEDPSPKATPQQTTTYTVTVVNTDGCTAEATIEVLVNVDNPTNLLKPSNFFSPNVDAINPTWNVGNIDRFQGCGVTIFDEKGLMVYEAKPYLNDWDGTSSGGKRLPDGVYYYMIRCDGDSGSRTGSITILR